tara:strand:+ start:1179 stop:1493 length:315 start_codon:yes stop_codon:yes gene_type:complete
MLQPLLILIKNMKSKNKWYFFYTNKQEKGTVIILTSHLRFSAAQLHRGDVKMTMVKLPEDAPVMNLANALGSEVPLEGEGEPLPVDFYKAMVYNTQRGGANMYR